MYEAFYGFAETPFRLSADEKFCFAHRHYERTYGCVTSSLEEGKSIILLTGLPGSGKTFLCRDVISKLDQKIFVAISIMLSQLSAEDLFRKLALELGLPAEQYNKMTLLSSIRDHMKDLRRKGKKIIVFLDEAHNLMTNDFAELRLLSSLQDLQYSVLQIVLIGNPQLRKSFLEAGVEHIPQETISTCEIHCMTVEQTQEYIKSRLVCVGWKRDPVIDESVYSIIYDVTQGVARSVNHVMNDLLLFAAFEKKRQINIDDALMVIETLINDDRLILHSGQTLHFIKERYKSGVFMQQASLSRHGVCGGVDHETSSCPVDGALLKQGQGIDDSTSKDNLTVINKDIEKGCEDVEYSFDDSDLPDTDLVGWDDHDLTPTSNEVMSQSAHTTPGVGHQTEFRQKRKRQDLESEYSKDEHQWCGVWWMSDNVRGKVQSNSIIVDELPSIKIERCPDLLSENASVWINDQRRIESKSRIKRMIILALIIFSSVLLLFLLLHYLV